MDQPIKWLMKRIAQSVSAEEHTRITQELVEYHKKYLHYRRCTFVETLIKQWSKQLKAGGSWEYKRGLRERINNLEKHLAELQNNPDLPPKEGIATEPL